MLDTRVPKEDFDAVAPFEPLYELVKTNKNEVWFYYEAKINKLVGWLGWWKNFSKDDLLQQAYIYYSTLCDQYDPYHNGHFYPFDRYLFKNLITKLRAYIQRYYFKGKREKPSEYCEYLLQNQTVDDTKEVDSEMYLEYVYSLLKDRQCDVVKLTLQGFKQQEIGKKLNISQSRVSVIKKKALRDLYMALDESHSDEEKREMHIEELKQYLFDKLSKNDNQ